MPLTLFRPAFCAILFSLAFAQTATDLLAANSVEIIREKVLRQLENSRAQNGTLEAWTARQKELREEFLKGAGLWPLPEKKPLKVIVHSRREYDGYSVENLALETM